VSTIGDFASSVLQALGAPATSANVQSIEDWAAQEGGGGANNPLNTTLQTAGSTGSINSVGVQNYANTADGVAATAQTLQGGNYSAIVSALKSGSGLIGAGGAVGSELSTWSGGGYDSLGGASEGSSSAVAGGSSSATTGADATLVSAGTSGNPVIDALEFLGNFTSLVPDLAGVVTVFKDGANSVGAVNHELAYIVDTALNMFKPGQAWRLVFTGVTVGVGAGAVVTFRAGGRGGGDHLPMAILLTGAALLAGFMAFRPWPVADGKPEKPGAYAYQIFEGQAPAAGPAGVSPAEVQTTEFALGTVEAIWALSKVSGTLKNITEAVYDAKQAALGWWGDLF
jgi:hypothetical protein